MHNNTESEQLSPAQIRAAQPRDESGASGEVMLIPDALFLDQRLGMNNLGVLITLAGRSMSGNAMTYDELSRWVGSERKARRILRELEDLGYLVRRADGTYAVVLL